MVAEQEIREFVGKIVEQFAPERVVLFGSYARGDATPDSDVDLLVIMPTEKEPIEQAVEIRQLIRRSFPLDLIVKTPTDVAWRLSLQDCFLTTIMTEGKMLYESVGS
jgi:uncharacterized protein